MTKRRKKPAGPGSPRVAPLPAPDLLPERLALLVDEMLVAGCPCRYPRVRAFGARESAAEGLSPLSSFEQGCLIAAFDAKVVLRDRVAHAMGHRGSCARCGSSIERVGFEVFRDSWLELLRIQPAAGITELGAPLSSALLRCRPIFAATPGDYRSEIAQLERAWPRVDDETFLTWLGARATTD